MITHDDYIQNNEMSATPDRKEKYIQRANTALHKESLFIFCPLFVLDILQLHHHSPFQVV